MREHVAAGVGRGISSVANSAFGAGPKPAAASPLPIGPLALLAATPAEFRVAWTVVAVFTVVTLGLAPIAAAPGPALPGFVPAYQTAVFLFYALSYLHLINHFRRTRVIPLLHIAVGCLFSAMILLIQMFSFRIWGPTQLVGSSLDTPIWLWCFWHVGPSALALSYVVALRRNARVLAGPEQSTGRMVLWSMLVVAGLTAVATAISTWALPWLPIISHGDDFHALLSSGVGPAILVLNLVALVLVWWRTRCSSSIALCLALSLVLLALDDILTLLGGSRLSLGWYFGRAEAAISAAVLLGFYMMEIDHRMAAVTSRAASLERDREALQEIVVEQNDANSALDRLARQDGLTGLANRRCFDDRLRHEWLRARREGHTLTLLMIDVDHFKLFNDSYGHPAGDRCLRAIAALLDEIAQRPADLAARYGGEEFVLLLPNTALDGGIGAAERLKQSLTLQGIPHRAARRGRVTVSIGIACHAPDRDDDDVDALVASADAALYAAKQAGRNCAMTDRQTRVPA